jgi:hypothetical protein
MAYNIRSTENIHPVRSYSVNALSRPINGLQIYPWRFFTNQIEIYGANTLYEYNNIDQTLCALNGIISAALKCCVIIILL